MRLLLDTVTFIRALQDPARLSTRAMAVLRSEDSTLELSAFSFSEIAIKSTVGKLSLNRDHILSGLSDLRVRVLPWNVNHALGLFDLPRHHNDPFDRHIISQALYEKIPVVTSDGKFKLYSGLQVIW